MSLTLGWTVGNYFTASNWPVIAAEKVSTLAPYAKKEGDDARASGVRCLVEGVSQPPAPQSTMALVRRGSFCNGRLYQDPLS